MGVEKHWYVDAWAVQEGKIFVSRRGADSVKGYIDTAGTTVFLSVPDLEPVPIGRITTAMRATRSGFQDRLHVGGVEVPFDTLDQVKDLVRRGYLGGGLGPGAAGALQGPGPAPVVDGGPAQAMLNSTDPAPWSDGGGYIPESAPDSLDAAVRDMAVASVLAWESLVSTDPPELLRPFSTFVRRLVWSGVLTHGDYPYPPDAWHSLHEEAHRWDAHRVAEALGVLEGPHFWPWYEPQLASSPRGLVHTAPLARLDTWDSRLHRLSEMHTLPVVDKRFWDSPRSTLDIAPFVLVGHLRGSPVIGRLPGEAPPSMRLFEEVRQELAQIALPEDAEAALAKYFDWCMDGARPPSHEPNERMAPESS